MARGKREATQNYVAGAGDEEGESAWKIRDQRLSRWRLNDVWRLERPRSQKKKVAPLCGLGCSFSAVLCGRAVCDTDTPNHCAMIATVDLVQPIVVQQAAELASHTRDPQPCPLQHAPQDPVQPARCQACMYPIFLLELWCAPCPIAPTRGKRRCTVKSTLLRLNQSPLLVIRGCKGRSSRQKQALS